MPFMVPIHIVKTWRMRNDLGGLGSGKISWQGQVHLSIIGLSCRIYAFKLHSEKTRGERFQKLVNSMFIKA